jgi:hypothetical protein
MAGVVKTDLDSIIQREIGSIGNVLQKGKTLFGISDRIQRDFWVGPSSAFPIVALFLEGGIFFLDPGRIQNHDGKHLFGWHGQEDVSIKSFLDKLGNEPGVVKVNMGEKEIVDLVRRNRKSLPVPVGIVPLLKQPAIDQDLQSAGIQKVA